MHPELHDKGAIVTGAGHGIGQALATRLAKEGARVVVNDVDAEAAERVAYEIGGYALPGDCADPAAIEALVNRSRSLLGTVDIFCANAGIDRTAPESLTTPDETWAQMLDVNVMAHVRAARLLIPDWLAAGSGGRFVVTASAASLLTMIGSAPYAVTKHASLAFAEWLSVTYGDRGVTVQAICPQSVQTKMLEQSGPVKDLLPPEDTLTPDEVVNAWVASLENDQFLVLPHPQVAKFYASRAADTERWLAGMRRLQHKADELSAIRSFETDPSIVTLQENR